jgi:hypothetical protein
MHNVKVESHWRIRWNHRVNCKMDNYLYCKENSLSNFEITDKTNRAINTDQTIFFWSVTLTSIRVSRFFFHSFLNISQTVGLLGRVISPSQRRYPNTGQHKHRINTYTHQTSMPWLGFKPTIPASERAKTVHALDGSAAVTGFLTCYFN